MPAVKLRIGLADNGRGMTLDEFLEAEETGGHRFELGGGILEVTQVPNTPHRRVVSNLYRAIARYDLAHPGLIESFGGGSEFRLLIPTMKSGRNPDLGVVFEGTLPDERGRTQPTLVGEVVSKRSRVRDYEVKRREYLAFGIHEYWVIDFELGRVVVLVRDGEDWTERNFEGDQVIESRLLPGLGVKVSELWTGVEVGADEGSY